MTILSLNISPFVEMIQQYGAVVVLAGASIAILCAFVGLFTHFFKKMLNHNLDHDQFMQDIRHESAEHTKLLDRLTLAYEQQSQLLVKHEKIFESMEQLLQLLSDKILLEKNPKKSTKK